MNNVECDPAVVAWFAKASVFHSVNSAPSANGGFTSKQVFIELTRRDVFVNKAGAFTYFLRT